MACVAHAPWPAPLRPGGQVVSEESPGFLLTSPTRTSLPTSMVAFPAGRPGDKFLVWGVNFFAAAPMFEGALQQEVAQQCGYRTPSSSYREEGTNSGMWLAVADPGATVTVPGVAPDAETDEATGRSQVKANALLLGKVFASRLSNCSLAPSGMGDLAKNASQYSERYASEAGCRRRTSR